MNGSQRQICRVALTASVLELDETKTIPQLDRGLGGQPRYGR